MTIAECWRSSLTCGPDRLKQPTFFQAQSVIEIGDRVFRQACGMQAGFTRDGVEIRVAEGNAPEDRVSAGKR